MYCPKLQLLHLAFMQPQINTLAIYYTFEGQSIGILFREIHLPSLFTEVHLALAVWKHEW
jgi:hypothetical protein